MKPNRTRSETLGLYSHAIGSSVASSVELPLSSTMTCVKSAASTPTPNRSPPATTSVHTTIRNRRKNDQAGQSNSGAFDSAANRSMPSVGGRFAHARAYSRNILCSNRQLCGRCGIRRSASSSAAAFEEAHTSSRLSGLQRHSCSTASHSVFVLPVPGGPNSRYGAGLAVPCTMCRTAICWRSFRSAANHWNAAWSTGDATDGAATSAASGNSSGSTRHSASQRSAATSMSYTYVPMWKLTLYVRLVSVRGPSSRTVSRPRAVTLQISATQKRLSVPPATGRPSHGVKRTVSYSVSLHGSPFGISSSGTFRKNWPGPPLAGMLNCCGAVVA